MSSTKGPIIVIDDDPDDSEIFQEACRDLNVPNKIRFFDNCADALYYMVDTSDKPLVIISDVNLPGMSGLEFRRKLIESDYLMMKSIPFVFLTTSSNPDNVIRAYKLMVQGYFVKPNSMEDLKQLIKKMLDYWLISLHPNSD